MSTAANAEKKDLRQLLTLGRSFWTVNLVFMLDGAGYFGVLNVLEFFLGSDGLKLSDDHATILISVLSGALTIFAALFGKLVDRAGVHRTILLTIVVAFFGRMLLGFAGASPFVVTTTTVALLLMAFSAGLMQSAVYAGVKATTTEATEAVGFSVPYALMNLGIILISVVSPFIRATSGSRGVILVCGAIAAVYLLIQLVGWREPLTRTVKGADELPDHPYREPAALLPARRHPLLDARFLFFIFILLGVRTLFAHQWLTMPNYIARAYSKSVAARYEWLTTINPLVVFIGTPFVAIVTRKIHVVNMMIAGTLISAAATFLLMSGPNFWLLIAYQIVFSIGECLWSSRFYEWVAKLAPKNQVGLYMGVAGVPWFLAKFTTGFYAGKMLTWLCPETGAQNTGLLWLIYGLVGMVSPIGLILGRRWLIRGTLQAQPS